MTTRRPHIPSISRENSGPRGLRIEGRMAAVRRPTVSRNRAKKARDLGGRSISGRAHKGFAVGRKLAPNQSASFNQ